MSALMFGALTSGSWAAAQAPARKTCSIGQMRATIGPGVSEKTEQHTGSVRLTNLSREACTLYGYPTLAFLGAAGKPFPFVFHHGGDQMITHSRPRLIEVEPEANAYFAFNEAQACDAPRAPAQTLRVRLPGEPGVQTIRLRRPPSPFITYCQGGFGHSVTVSPFEPRFVDTVCHTAKSC
jgi:hypothetical protein